MTFLMGTGFYDPVLPMSASQQEKSDAPVISAGHGEISLSTLYHEIVRTEVTWDGIEPLANDVTATISFYNDDTGNHLFTGTQTWKAGWSHAWMKAWIGHLPSGEIDKGGNYRADFTAPGIGSESSYFSIFDTTPQPGGDWQPYTYAFNNIVLETPIVTKGNLLRISADVTNIGYASATITVHTVFDFSSLGYANYPIGGNETLHRDFMGNVNKDVKSGYYYVGLRIASEIYTLPTKVYYDNPDMPAIPEEPGEPTLPGFWENLRDLVTTALQKIGQLIGETALYGLESFYKAIFGTDIHEGAAGEWLSFLPGVNFAYKLEHGVNLAGEEEALFTFWDAADMLSFIVVLPADDLAKFFSKLDVPLAKYAGDDVVKELTEQLAKGNFDSLSKTVWAPKLWKFFDDFWGILSKRITHVWKFLPKPGSFLALVTAGVIAAMGFGAWASWPATDNVAESVKFDMSNIARKFRDKEITKQDALNQLNATNDYLNAAGNFIDTQYSINPIVRFLTPTFKLNVDYARDKHERLILEINNTPDGLDPHYSVQPDGEIVYDVEPTEPGAPYQPTDEIIIPLVPGAAEEYNSWKVTIYAIDAITQAQLNAAILINDVFMDKVTPYFFYFAPEATYNIKLRKKGYRQGEVTFKTKALPGPA